MAHAGRYGSGLSLVSEIRSESWDVGAQSRITIGKRVDDTRAPTAAPVRLSGGEHEPVGQELDAGGRADLRHHGEPVPERPKLFAVLLEEGRFGVGRRRVALADAGGGNRLAEAEVPVDAVDQRLQHRRDDRAAPW